VKWVFALLTVLVVALALLGSRHPAGQPVVEIEGRQAPYAIVHVVQDARGDDRMAVWFHDAESDIDFFSRLPSKKGREIIAWQITNKLGRNYEEWLRSPDRSSKSSSRR